jgi:hypothetical protein
MLNACVKPVISLRKTGTITQKLYTKNVSTNSHPWTNTYVIPLSIHNFCIQLCTTNLYKNTEVGEHFSPLSTPLIINTIHENKENILVGNGG